MAKYKASTNKEVRKMKASMWILLIITIPVGIWLGGTLASRPPLLVTVVTLAIIIGIVYFLGYIFSLGFNKGRPRHKA